MPKPKIFGVFTRSNGRCLFQNVIPAEVSLVCVVKPDEFWDKKVTHFCFWKEKDRLGFEVSTINPYHPPPLSQCNSPLGNPCLQPWLHVGRLAVKMQSCPHWDERM